MRKREGSLLLVLFSLAVILVLLSVIFALNRPEPRVLHQIRDYDVFFIVQEGNLGLDVNNSLLTFGKVPPGMCSVIRTIEVDNKNDFGVNITLIPSDNLKDYFGKLQDYYVDKDEIIEIGLSVCIPENATYGNYTGKMKVYLDSNELEE